jgi:hypothetical protein
MGVTWDYVIGQASANKIGPLGKRAGIDIQENNNYVMRMQHLPNGGVWVNIGQENSDSNEMQRNLKEMKERNQTVGYDLIDLEKVDLEVYVVERAYSNSSDTFLNIFVVFLPKNEDPANPYTYIRPDGYYYNGLTYYKQNIGNTEPPFKLKINVMNYKEEKQV